MAQLTQQGYRALKKSEGLKLQAYQDGAGVWTIGYGTTRIDGKPVTKGMRITEERADALFAKDLEVFTSAINSAIGSAKTSDYQFDAFVNITYNIGISAMSGSTFMRRHKDGDYTGCAQSMLSWNKITVKGVKVVSQGLANRRKREADMYLHGVYVL
ncbi:endolysin [Yersinia phage vB_YenM_P778]